MGLTLSQSVIKSFQARHSRADENDGFNRHYPKPSKRTVHERAQSSHQKQGLRVATIGGSVVGGDFSDLKFHPVWAKADKLGPVLFIHPQSTPALTNAQRAAILGGNAAKLLGITL